MTKILRLIYSGAVEVPARDMRPFVKAAKYLQLQGFDQIEPSHSVEDIFGQVPAKKRCFSIKLKRIDDENFAMDTACVSDDDNVDDQPNQSTMTNGDDPHGENNGNSISSDSSDDESGKGAVGNGEGDGGDADADAEDENSIGKNMAHKQNGFPLSSSSSSSSECGSFEAPADKISGKIFSCTPSDMSLSRIINFLLKFIFQQSSTMLTNWSIVP